MGLLIYGTNKVIIGLDEFLMRCPSCQSDTWQDVMVSSVYLHFFWIPSLPIDKLADTHCTKCGNRRYERGFDENLIKDYKEVKKKFRHPFYLYVVPAIILMGILTGIVFSIIPSKQ
jgi:hypothetical protein